MILQIDGIYFNPLTITVLTQSDGFVRMYLADSETSYLKFKNWMIDDLAARINELIKEFNNG